MGNEENNTRIIYRPVIDAAKTLGGSGEGWDLLMAYFDVIYSENSQIDESLAPTIKCILLQNVESIRKANQRRLRYEMCVENGLKGKEYGKLGGRPRKGETPEEARKRRETTIGPQFNENPKETPIDIPNKTPIGKNPLTPFSNPKINPLNVNYNKNKEKEINKEKESNTSVDASVTSSTVGLHNISAMPVIRQENIHISENTTQGKLYNNFNKMVKRENDYKERFNDGRWNPLDDAVKIYKDNTPTMDTAYANLIAYNPTESDVVRSLNTVIDITRNKCIITSEEQLVLIASHVLALAMVHYEPF